MIRLITIVGVALSCISVSAEDLGGSDSPSTRNAARAAKAVNEHHSVLNEIRTKDNDGMTEYYRADRLVLSHSGSIPSMYHIRGPSGVYAIVLVNKANSPQIHVEPNCPVSIEISRDANDALRMQVFDPELPFIEEYIVTPKSVSLISAEEYARLQLIVKDIKAHFDSVLGVLRGSKAIDGP
jgi:hypothetical protein